MMENRRSVLDTGAISATDELQTAAFQRALDEVYLAGGGVVEVPAGVWNIGSIRLRSNTTLHLLAGAVLRGSRNPEDYNILREDSIEPLPSEVMTDKLYEPPSLTQKRDYSFLLAGSRWSNALIRIAYAKNVAVIGEEGSIIDGCDCYDPLGEEYYRGPHGIGIHASENIRLAGYTAQNTGNWAHCIWYSKNIHAEHITVLGGHDGIHLKRCENVTIRDCGFYTGDDCVSGFGNLNVTVTDCVMNTACSGMRFGGTNVFVERCRFYGPAQYFFRGSLTTEEKKAGARANIPHRTNMLSVFTYYADCSVEIPHQPGNIVIRDCTAENVDRFLHYNFSGNEVWQAARPLSSISFEHIRAEGISMALTAYGSPDCPLSLAIRHSDIRLEPSAPAFLHTAYFRRIELEQVHITADRPIPLIRSWSPAGDLVMDGVSGDVESEITMAHEPFRCTAI